MNRFNQNLIFYLFCFSFLFFYCQVFSLAQEESISNPTPGDAILPAPPVAFPLSPQLPTIPTGAFPTAPIPAAPFPTSSIPTFIGPVPPPQPAIQQQTTQQAVLQQPTSIIAPVFAPVTALPVAGPVAPPSTTTQVAAPAPSAPTQQPITDTTVQQPQPPPTQQPITDTTVQQPLPQSTSTTTTTTSNAAAQGQTTDFSIQTTQQQNQQFNFKNDPACIACSGSRDTEDPNCIKCKQLYKQFNEQQSTGIGPPPECHPCIAVCQNTSDPTNCFNTNLACTACRNIISGLGSGGGTVGGTGHGGGTGTTSAFQGFVDALTSAFNNISSTANQGQNSSNLNTSFSSDSNKTQSTFSGVTTQDNLKLLQSATDTTITQPQTNIQLFTVPAIPATTAKVNASPTSATPVTVPPAKTATETTTSASPTPASSPAETGTAQEAFTITTNLNTLSEGTETKIAPFGTTANKGDCSVYVNDETITSRIGNPRDLCCLQYPQNKGCEKTIP